MSYKEDYEKIFLNKNLTMAQKDEKLEELNRVYDTVLLAIFDNAKRRDITSFLSCDYVRAYYLELTSYEYSIDREALKMNIIEKHFRNFMCCEDFPEKTYYDIKANAKCAYSEFLFLESAFFFFATVYSKGLNILRALTDYGKADFLS